MARRQQTALGSIERRNVPRRGLSDLYHNLIARSWLRLLGLLVSVYVVANLLFATLYSFGRGCVTGATSFGDLFFFSVHTMSTIGYGTMAPKTTYAQVLVTMEAFGGTLFVAIVTGLVFAKFSRPTARVIFSKNVVVVERDGKRLLQFRMANERANQIVEATIRVAAARTEVMADGERMRRFYDLKLQRDRNLMFILSWTCVHELDEQSPLHGLSIEEMKQQQLQLVCSLIGTDETFSQQVHARHYYVPEDFAFNQRFADILGIDDDGTRWVDYATFHELVPMGTASARAARGAAS